MQLPILSIVGPTASGKTKLALNLAEMFVAEGVAPGVAIISADSRQVYRDLEILTGGDVPENFEQKNDKELNFTYFADSQKGNTYFHGVSIIGIKDEWSVAHFRKMSHQLIKKYIVKNYIIIIVGGTGLYHDHLLSIDPNINVAPDLSLREKANQLSLEKLKQWAENVNPTRYQQMNHSDQNNPRRLIRLIEVAAAEAKATTPTEDLDFLKTLKHLYLGIRIEPEALEKKIRERVLLRLHGGAMLEVERAFNLLNDRKAVSPAHKTLGFLEILAYSQGQISQEECVEMWVKKELSYVKRQMTWFKKNKKITWLKAENPEIVKEAYTCYTKFYDVSIF